MRGDSVSTEARADKPLGAKAYGHIGHLPGSRMGPGDHRLNDGQARIATVRSRDRRDRVWVQEKLDGSCVAVARIDGALVPLIRAGYRAVDSHREQHRLFAAWVWENADRFDFIDDGERVVGEWLAQAHGTRYDLTGRDPFVAFDVMTGDRRLTVLEMAARVNGALAQPAVLATQPTSIEDALLVLGEHGRYGALDPVEGCVWRVERDGKVDFLAKYVRPDKVDGAYFDEPVWNWRPDENMARAMAGDR